MRESLRRTIDVNGVRLSYLEWGVANPHGPSLLCLHGLMATAETFSRMVEGLSAECHAVALDLPGNGASENAVASNVGFAGLAALVQAFADALGLARLVVIGHSHGGALALKLASSRPQSLRGLVLLCPAHPFSGYEESLVRFYLSPAGRLCAYLIPWLPQRLQQFGFNQMLGSSGSVNAQWFQPYRRNLRRRGTIAHLLRLLTSWQADMADLGKELRLRPLTLLVLLIWGSSDQVVPASTRAALMAHMQDAECALLPGIGHLPNEEAPERCGRLISDWLARLP